MSVAIEFALPEKRAARRAFDRAASRFDAACFVHDEARRRLLERLDFVRLDPQVVVDLGCATGQAAMALAARYPAARVLALDSSRGMLAAAAARERLAVVGGDAEQWPLRSACAELVFANLVLPWCRPNLLFAEAARVLRPGGALLFATLGPDTLAEVRGAFAAVDERIHVHAAFDMHDLGDLAMAAGLAEPVLDVDRLEVTYGDLGALLRDLRAVGAVNVAGGRRRTLTGRERWRGFERRLGPVAGQRFAVTVELILGQAWGREPRPASGPPGEVRVPIERIRRAAETT
jgi:malonyl-CoA O-methyltransferase